ncbi:MAG: hypothetical protein JXR60_11610 [Bacteroidales bacterium]|nr:hypothetical protein [Bacteroidales bacterium]
MKSFLIILLVAFSVVSCKDANVIFEDYYSFGDILWQKNDQPQMSISIDQEQAYQFVLLARLANGYPYRELKVKVSLKDESGNVNTKILNSKVRDENNHYNGEMMGDLIDYEFVLIQDTTLATGTYTATIEEMQEPATLPFVMEIGLRVNKKQ